jgi:sortase A
MADMSSSFEDEPGSAGSGSTRVDQDSSGGPEPRTPQKRVSPFTVIGIAMLVAGLSCLGWVGYQYWGTNVVSEKTFQTERQQLRTKWANPGPSAARPDDQVKAVPGDVIGLLRIPAFGDKYEIPIINGTQLSVLSKGVGHYVKTAQPGQIGNFAIAGHRVTHGEPFARLLELNKGDKVVVETRDTIYTYVLDDSPRSLTVKDTDTWVIDPVPGKPDAKPSQALITLTTCQDLFHSPDRSIGFGHLESTKNK